MKPYKNFQKNLKLFTYVFTFINKHGSFRVEKINGDEVIVRASDCRGSVRVSYDTIFFKINRNYLFPDYLTYNEYSLLKRKGVSNVGVDGNYNYFAPHFQPIFLSIKKCNGIF